MEKLIELLNEFGNINRNKEMIDRQDTYIISKRFGFIEWLVENDKIDFNNNKLQVIKDIDVRGEVIYDCTLFDKVDGVIMLLSISDNPIQDLCDLLK